MGAEISAEHGFIIATAPAGLHGATIWLDFPSVGATENLLMAAVLAKGITEIDNAAREPEIVDICAMLTGMGAHIQGAGTSKLVVEGVSGASAGESLDHRGPHRGRDVGLRRRDYPGGRSRHGHRPGFLEIALDKVHGAGATVETTPDGFRVRMDRRPSALDIVTLPFPGFPTDLLPMAIGLAAVSDGASMITENIFDGRFMFVQEMVRLGRGDPYRRQARSGSRAASGSRPRRWWRRTSEPARVWSSPPSVPTALPMWATRTTSTAAIRTSCPTCASSAPR